MGNGGNRHRLALLLGIVVFSFGLWQQRRRTATDETARTFLGIRLKSEGEPGLPVYKFFAGFDARIRAVDRRDAIETSR